MRLPSTDGVELAVHDLGGHGPPLLACHATGFHGLVWAPVASHLVDHFHVWALDFRAHGDSTRPSSGDLHWRGYGDDVTAVVDGLGLEGAFGLGHSMGGAALVLAEQARPGTFRSLYAFEPIIFPPDRGSGGGDALAAGAERRRSELPSLEAAVSHFSARPPLSTLDPSVLRAYVEHGFEPGPDGGVRLKCRREDEAATYRTGATHGAWDHLGEVGCPVVVAAGAESEAIGPELATRLAAHLPAGRAEVLDGLGHFGPLEDPPRVAAAAAAALLGR